jgi:hypothetical protein
MRYGAEILTKQGSPHSGFCELLRAIGERHFKDSPASSEHDYWRRVGTLSPGERAVLLADEFSGEVHNGGFDQYFMNGGFRRAHATVQALELFGFVEMAAFLRRAIELARIPDPIPPEYEYDTDEPDRPYGSPSPVSVLDEEFYQAYTNRDWCERILYYVRKHPEEFA